MTPIVLYAMRCPRCEGELETLSVEATGKSAFYCGSCGFTGISASHHFEGGDIESWDQAKERFDESGLSERTVKTDRTGGISVPTENSEPNIDPARLDESVKVVNSLRDRDSEDGDNESNNEEFELTDVDAEPIAEESESTDEDREAADQAA